MAKPRKKILFVITKSNWGGAQRYVFDLATRMPLEHYDVAVAYGGTGVSGSAPGKLAEMLATEGIRTIFIPELGRDVSIPDDYRSFRSLIHLFRHERPDIIHLNSSKIGGLGAAAGRLAGVPHIVFTAHGWPFWEDRPLLERAALYAASYLSALLAHTTIVIHHGDLRSTRFWPLRKRALRLIPNGIAEFRRDEKGRAREILAKGAGARLWLGTIAELHRSNNLGVAIDAVLTYNRRATEKILFVIIGAGEERERLEERIRRAGAEKEIVLAGFQPNAASLLSAFDAFLFIPKKAGLPYALLEAGLAGLPVIAAGVGGITDIIDNGKTGIVLPAATVGATERALAELFSNYSAEYGERLREKVRADFSLERCIAETMRIYENQS